jgi:hypothetical protein
MPTMIDLPIVSSCSVETCGYNHDGCHAGAISVGSPATGSHAHCNTFADTAAKGGHAQQAAVGACSRTDCAHNTDMACGATAIDVGSATDMADCLTFTPRS